MASLIVGMSDVLPPKIYIARSPVHGNGVFAMEAIQAGQIIHRCPCIVLEPQWIDIQTVLHDYLYCWPKEGDGRAVVLGSGSLFNHQQPANADWETDEATRWLTYRAVCDIKASEEIFIDYGQDYWDNQHAGSTSQNRTDLQTLLDCYRKNR